MELSWQTVKELYDAHKDWFYALGSLAGVAAFFRPVLESKYQRDQERSKKILTLLPEQVVVDLEPRLYQSRMVPDSTFQPFDQLRHELRTSQDAIRFSGPLQKYLKRELNALLAAYDSLRELVQVPEWEPKSRGEEEAGTYYWDFNKDAFRAEHGFPKDYAEHLDQCVDRARSMRRAYQRFQIVADLHLLEAPLAWWLVKRRAGKINAAQI